MNRALKQSYGSAPVLYILAHFVLFKTTTRNDQTQCFTIVNFLNAVPLNSAPGKFSHIIRIDLVGIIAKKVKDGEF